MHKQRFFIALLPPQEIQDSAVQIQQCFADRYNSRAAQKSPPHITLQPPFEWLAEEVTVLHQHLSEFALQHTGIPIRLEGFAAFPPRVIFINVLKTPELLQVQAALTEHVATTLGVVDPRAKSRPFAPHMTVAFRDLTKPNFKVAWQEFQGRSFQAEFLATDLTLLIHDGHRWNVCAEFPFTAVID